MNANSSSSNGPADTNATSSSSNESADISESADIASTKRGSIMAALANAAKLPRGPTSDAAESSFLCNARTQSQGEKPSPC